MNFNNSVSTRLISEDAHVAPKELALESRLAQSKLDDTLINFQTLNLARKYARQLDINPPRYFTDRCHIKAVKNSFSGDCR